MKRGFAARALTVLVGTVTILTPAVAGLYAAWTDWTIDDPDVGAQFTKLQDVDGHGSAEGPAGVEIKFRFWYYVNGTKTTEKTISIESQSGAGGTWVWANTIVSPGGDYWHVSPYNQVTGMRDEDHGVQLRGPRDGQSEANYVEHDEMIVNPEP